MFIQQKKFTLPLLMGFLLISMACATSIPFLNSEPETAPAEAPDQNAIQTMIADAVNQKVSQTLEAIPPTPLPTETPLPSPTATEIPPTSTPTEVVYPETGSKVQENDDGSTTYFDYTGAYRVDIPAQWLAIRPGSIEYNAAWLLPEASVPEINASLQAMQSFDSNIFRIFALDVQEGHYSDGFVSNINFVLDHQNTASLEETFAQSVLALPDAISGLAVTSAEITATSLGVPVGIIESEWDAEGNTEQVIRIYQRQALFAVRNSFLIITFTSTVDFKDQLLGGFEIMVDGFEILD